MFRLFAKRDPVLHSEKKDGIDMKSVELLLGITQSEYNNEYERTNMIQSKAGIALPIIAAYFLTIAQMNDYKSMFQVTVTTVRDILLSFGLCVSYSLALILAIAAVFFVARVEFAKGYKRINPQSFCKEASLSQEYQSFVRNLMHQYFDAIDHNAKANDQKMKMYKQGWSCTFVSVACFLAYVILKNNS